MSKLILATILQALMVPPVFAETATSLQHISKRPYASPPTSQRASSVANTPSSIKKSALDSSNSDTSGIPSLNLWMLGSRPYLAPATPMSGDGD